MQELNIAKTILSKRKAKGITQDELASYIGVSKASVSKWETGQSYPDITFLPQLASYFNISIDELVDYSPQMIKEDIHKLYKKLSEKFTCEPFDDVIDEIHQIIKKYYSCYSLIFHMALIMVNHYELMNLDKKSSLIKECVQLFQHVKANSQDMNLCKTANSMEATCYLLLGQPKNLIEILESSDLQIHDSRNLLSMGYSMTGQFDKAKEVLQVSIFQSVLQMQQNLSTLLGYYQEDLDKQNEIILRLNEIERVFALDNLNPASMISVYLTIAQVYAIRNDAGNCLKMLKKYCDIVVDDIFPIKLHGDSFFDTIENYFENLDLGTDAPRNSQTIKNSILKSLVENPAFKFLDNNIEFKEIVEKIKSKIGV